MGLRDDAYKRIVEAIANTEEPCSSSVTPATPPELTDFLGEDSIEHIILERLLGRGASGFVVAGTQTNPVHRKVAVKILRPGIDGSRVLARFEAERQALARLEGCSVPTVYSAGFTKLGRPFVCTQFVEGLPITSWCDAHQLGVEQRIELLIDACRTLQQAHDAGIVHRDLKPANMLVSDTANGPRVILIDFGVAKAVGEPLSSKPLTTLDGEFLGTPEYMSPEQTKSAADVGFETDIWAMGILIHKLCSGTEPFRRHNKDTSSLARLIHDICNEEPREILGSFRHSLVDRLAKKCLEKEPKNRFASASELATELENVHGARKPKKKTGRVAALVLLVLSVVVFTAIKSGVLSSNTTDNVVQNKLFLFDGASSYTLNNLIGRNLSGLYFTFKVKMPKVSMTQTTQRLFQKRLGAWAGIDVWVWSDPEHPERSGKINLLIKDNFGVAAEVTGVTSIDDNQWHAVKIYLPPVNSSLSRGIIVVDGMLDGSLDGKELGEVSNDAVFILGDGSNQGKGHFLRGEIMDFQATRQSLSWWDKLSVE